MSPARWWRALSALALVCALPACDELLVPDRPANTPVAMFDQVWSDFDRYYAHFALSGVDWQAARARWRPRAAAASSDFQLAVAIAGLLGELHDPHVTLYTPNWTYQDTSTFRPGCSEPTVTDGYVATSATSGGHIEFGRLDAATGYVRISSFTGAGWADEVEEALAQLQGVSSMVVDVRGNGGGSPETATSVAQHFLDRGGVAEYIRFRSGPAHDDFGAPFAVNVAPEGARRFTGRVALLTDRRDFSAAESFVLDMRVSPSVTVVGDTTGGASGRPLVRELPNGWTYRLSTWVAYTPSGKPYEGIGLPPDLPIQPRPGDWSRGIDRVLETALAALRTP